MKPSDIVIATPTPLTGVFGQSEAEAAAALLIIAMRESGDEWVAITLDSLRHILEKVPTGVVSWLNNPFVNPDLHRLVADGYAEFVGDETTVRFSEKGLEALRVSRWNRKRS